MTGLEDAYSEYKKTPVFYVTGKKMEIAYVT
jgi:hypothetical protein